MNYWIEKYRPKHFSELKGQKEINALLSNSLVCNNQTHYIFYGPSGTGKTSSALIFCNLFYSSTDIKNYVLEINASYDSDIGVVQNKIKNFCQKSVDSFNYNGNVVHHKIIILDEADTLSNEAQQALRRYIEVYSFNTRFIFLCNYITKIIYPIISRCTTYYFGLINEEDSLEYLLDISDKENILFDGDKKILLNKISSLCNGDLRSCTTALQSIYMMYSIVSNENIDKYFLIFPVNFFDDLNVVRLKNNLYIEKYVNLKISTIIERSYSIKSFILYCIEYISRYSINDIVLDYIYNLSIAEKYSLFEKDNYVLLNWIMVNFIQVIKSINNVL